MLELLFSSTARVKVLALLLLQPRNQFLLSPEEFRARAQTGNGFLQNVLTGPKLFLAGDENALRALIA